MNGYDFSNEKAVIIGGSTGMGFAAAKLIIALGGEVIIASRSQEKLNQAKAKLNSKNVSSYVLDNTDGFEIKAFFKEVGSFHYLFTPGATYQRGPITESMEVAKSVFDGKFWPQYMSVKYALPHLAKTGSIVLMSGAYSVRPTIDSGASYVACNAAIEALVKALAIEIAPIRINAVSPGAIKSTVWEQKGQQEFKAFYEDYIKRVLLHRLGEVEEIAETVVYLLKNKNTTGTTLYPDGGFILS